MNKQRYRLVFNARRGQIMAVAESASSIGSGSSGAKASGLGLALTLVVAFTTPATGQIIADPNAPANQRATVHSAPNGVPLVNIQTPTAGGVSRNTYRQFDVQGNGAILNNSRTQVQTQLGGWVPGNPWLAAGPARIIVNEVNSSNPSLLKGYVEVAGQRAQVIIANPSGIQVTGGGFINASQATLTTGRPVWSGGDLEGFRVQGGTIRIDGTGLDTSSADYTAILARAVEVNAGIWAQELKVITGANHIGADTASTVGSPASATGAAPAFALDVAQLGGMYARKIQLIGTEAGVGVNLRGVVGATAGDVVVDASGWLRQTGTLQAEGQVRVRVQGDLLNTGDIYARTALNVASSQTLTNHGQMQANGAVDLEAKNIANQVGARIASSTDAKAAAAESLRNEGEMAAGGQWHVRADTVNNAHGQVSTLNELRITATGMLDNTLGHVQSMQSNVQIEAAGMQNSGEVHAGQDLKVAVVGDLVNQGALAAAGNTDIAARSVDSAGMLAAGLKADGQMAAAGDLRVETLKALRTSGLNLSAGNAAFTGSSIDLSAARMGAKNISLLATTGDIDTSAATVVARETFNVSANSTQLQKLNNAGGAIYAEKLQVQLSNLSNANGNLVQTGNAATVIALQSSASPAPSGTLDNQGGTKQGVPGTSFIKPAPSGINIQFRWDAKSQRTTFYPLGEMHR